MLSKFFSKEYINQNAFLSALLIILSFFYFFGLGSVNIPKNGDEYPYLHITAQTAQQYQMTGQWLPLQSHMEGMRNTKPPLLFWQGMVSKDIGLFSEGDNDWTLTNFRWPVVVYTLLLSALIGAVAARLSGAVTTGLLAALIYLCFLSTYRFGRPFLTNAPETFWLSLPFFALLYWPRLFNLSLLKSLALCVVMAVCVGIGLLYKSFALLAPVSITLALWWLCYRQWQIIVWLRNDMWKIAVISFMALSIFGLWFVIDPMPKDIWQEFVVGENAKKFQSSNNHYIKTLLWGGSSIWALALAFIGNAGFLLFPVLACFIVFWRKRRSSLSASSLHIEHKFLWMWIVVYFVIFSFPSQRSGRYLLDVMPALAILLALAWPQISKGWFITSLLITGIFGLLMGYLLFSLQAFVLQQPTIFTTISLYSPLLWLILIGVMLTVFIGLFLPRWRSGCVLLSIVLIYGLVSTALQNIDQSQGVGQFSNKTIEALKDKPVWVPCNFRAAEEGHRFLLPKSKVIGYRQSTEDNPNEMAYRYTYFALEWPLKQALPPCPDCQILDRRIKLRSRHKASQFQEMMLGQLFEQLFAYEYLVQSTIKNPEVQALNSKVADSNPKICD